MFEREKKLRWSKLKVGLVITLALLTLCLAVFFAGNIEYLLSPKIELKAQFRDVRGLRKGAPVWIFGTEVGSVKEIELDPIYGTIVTISVAKNVREFIKKDSEATIMTMGLLGDKFVELTAGSPYADPIREDEIIKGSTEIEFKDIMETSAKTIGKMTEFIQKLQDLVARIEKGEGTLAKFIMDPSVYDNVNKASQTLTALLEEFKGRRGTVKMLIEDPALYQSMLATTTSIGELTKKLNESSGSFRKFIDDPALYDKFLSASSQLEDLIGRVKQSQGTLIKLLEDPEIYENLHRSSELLASILGRLDQGEGLAGALIRDEEMANDVKETLSRLKDLSIEADRLARSLRELTRDMKENPKKYFKLSVF